MKNELQSAIDVVNPFLNILLSAPVGQLGEILQDEVKMLRLKNASRLARNARTILEQHGVTAKDMPASAIPDVVMGLIEAGSKTSDPQLSEMFANLLASAILPETAELTHPSYGHILAQFSPIDARIVKACFDEYTQNLKPPTPYHPSGYRSSLIHGKVLEETLGSTTEIIELSIINLQRLGLAENLGEGFRNSSTAVLTPFGLSFAQACLPRLS